MRISMLMYSTNINLYLQIYQTVKDMLCEIINKLCPSLPGVHKTCRKQQI